MPPPSSLKTRSGAVMGFPEFVLLIAALTAINALGIDTMLPALPGISRSLGLTHANQQQWIVSVYLLGFGVTTLVYGPLADRFGRRPVTLVGLCLYVATSLFASFATSFTVMIVARTMQGMAAAASRVLAVAIVRDCYSGREMARVMSLTFIVFLTVPMLAPSIGQLILLVAPWRWIFLMLAAFAAGVALWFGLRLGETLHPDNRRPIVAGELIAAVRLIFTNRESLGYTLALTMSFGAMVGFISSAQQLFAVTFHTPTLFPILFAFIAGGMALASFVNSRIVMRLGSRRVSHGAMVAYIALAALHVASVMLFGDNLVSFAIFQFVISFFGGLLGSNFGAMAMEPMGTIAGTASSVQGMISSLGGALVGIVVGQSFDGTATPVIMGYFVCSLFVLAAVLYGERGRLFRPHHSTLTEA